MKSLETLYALERGQDEHISVKHSGTSKAELFPISQNCMSGRATTQWLQITIPDMWVCEEVAIKRLNRMSGWVGWSQCIRGRNEPLWTWIICQKERMSIEPL